MAARVEGEKLTPESGEAGSRHLVLNHYPVLPDVT